MDQAVLVDQFLKLYYEMLVAKPVDLGKLYREGSRLNFEGEKIRGRESILAQLTSHPFSRCKHSITTVDHNASDNDGGLLEFVNGVLDFVQQDREGHALNFS
ncbi:hypothetical protein ACJRO7_033199 [Eucalyptus globulus]|uniref:NTF2 domain-containing protein n=1 Tax=Eucalyptus globulus TaxID=34317 RepID=A0ABD3JKH2_EUCGL